MAKLVSDELWTVFEPLLPPTKPRRLDHPGRKPVDNRVALSVILFVLKTGIPWEDVPQEMGCCGMAAWKKLQEWQEAGVWEKLHQVILQELEAQGKLDWDKAAVDTSSVRATQGGTGTGPNPTDRAKPGTKHHALTEGQGLPLAVKVTGANRNDITQLKPLVEAIPKLKTRGKGRKRRKRPKKLLADRAYDSQPHREWLEEQGVVPKLAKRNTAHGSGLGKERWVVERLFAWLHDDRKIRVRDERQSLIHAALVKLAAALICFTAL
jgi:transposase